MVNGRPQAVAESRRVLRDAIGEESDLTLLRAPGNLGDELIRAGTHRLLGGLRFREIPVDDLPAASGRTLLLPGSGAWCRTYHEWMPRALQIGELRFERVIVLPSSFDTGEDVVRETLVGSRATVFAREAESLEMIRPLCAAELAHDCAFFFDYEPWKRAGSGVLNAFRTDSEKMPDELPQGNVDISVEADDLDGWLDLIADHAEVRTDRAHVMIAAALMGKRVGARASLYHKVPALAESWLGGYPVELADPPSRPPTPASREIRESRVTCVVVTREPGDQLKRCVTSVARSGAVGAIVVVDSNSDPALGAGLEAIENLDGRVAIRRTETDVGRAGGRRLAVESIHGEFVLFVDEDVELEDGAIERLQTDLDRHPKAVASTVTRPASGTPWLPIGCWLVRRSTLRDFPVDDQMATGLEDVEWGYRVAQAGLTVRACRRARASRRGRFALKPPSSRLADVSSRVEQLVPLARFLKLHGAVPVVPGVEQLVPELQRPDGTVDAATLRPLLELLASRGATGTVIEWMNGGLDPVWERGRSAPPAEQSPSGGLRGLRHRLGLGHPVRRGREPAARGDR